MHSNLPDKAGGWRKSNTVAGFGLRFLDQAFLHHFETVFHPSLPPGVAAKMVVIAQAAREICNVVRTAGMHLKDLGPRHQGDKSQEPVAAMIGHSRAAGDRSREPTSRGQRASPYGVSIQAVLPVSILQVLPHLQLELALEPSF